MNQKEKVAILKGIVIYMIFGIFVAGLAVGLAYYTKCDIRPNRAEAAATSGPGYCDDGDGIVYIEATTMREAVDTARKWRAAHRDRWKRRTGVSLDSAHYSNGSRISSIVIHYYTDPDSLATVKMEE